MFGDISNWRFTDLNEGGALSKIERISDRARSLFVRNKDAPILKMGFINIYGAIDMMGGLDYHAENFTRVCAALAQGAVVATDAVNNEAVAYLNRAGQFHAFAKSEFVEQLVPNALDMIPSISRVMIFRNKHTAHRSIDAPRGEANIEEHWRHAQSLGTLGGRLFSPRPGKKFVVSAGITDLETLQKELWSASFWTINTFDPRAGDQINFTLEQEHQTIIAEAYSLLERLLTGEHTHLLTAESHP